MTFWIVPEVIRIDFPALDRLIDYLTSQSTLQAAVNDLTQKVAASSAPLAEALSKQK